MSPRVMAFAALSLAVVMSAGCANTKTASENATLLQQNKALADQLAQARAAQEAAEARANLPAPGETAETMPAPAAMDTGTPDMLPPPGSTNEGNGISVGRNANGEDTITVASDILFDSGKATLKPAAKRALDRVAAIIKKSYAGQQLRVEGYTDPNPVKHSGWDDNWDLGASRARAVMLYLRGRGIRDMYIASFGDTHLKSTKNYAADRRVEIVVVRNGR